MMKSTEGQQEKASPEPKGSVRQWAFRYRPDEGKVAAALRGWLRIFFIIVHEYTETAISLRASALTFTIVLSIVPILAMSTAILKGMGSDNQMRIAAYKFIDQLEPEQQAPETKKNQPDGQSGQGEGKVKEDEKAPVMQSIPSHLRNAIDTIFDYVNRTNFAALGIFGIVGLLFTFVLVLSTVEDAMNAIWHTREGRSIFRKIMDYLALLILLPISINVAIAGDAILESPKMLAYLNTFIPSEWAVRMLLKFLPFLFVILSLMVMYLFFPNIRVKTYAAFTGALFAGFFWFLVQKIYIILQIGVAKYNAIYGSFATLPLFLVWVQIGWTFILLGASLAYAIQNRSMYHLPGTSATPQRNLQIAFDVLNTIYSLFSRKKPATIDDLVQANPGEFPGQILSITEILVKGGFIHQVENGNRSTYVPATTAEKIEARQIVQFLLGHEDIPTPGGIFARQVITAAEQAIPAEVFPMLPEEKKPEEEYPEPQVADHEQNEKTL